MLELTDVSSAKRVAGVLNAYPANPAIVLGGQVSGLAVTRSLGRRGVPVAVLDPEERALAKASRYAVASATVPSPLDGAQPALSWLGDLGRALRRPAVLLPTGDEWALAVARHGPGLGRGFVAPAAGSDVVDSILNKARLYAAALDVGMPVPRFAIINPKSLKEAEDIVGYPCVVKPSEKGDFVHRFGQAALTAESREDLLAIVDGAGDRELLLQELLPLEDAALQTAAVYVDRDGRLAASFGGRRLAVYPTGFGTSCQAEPAPGGSRLSPALTYGLPRDRRGGVHLGSQLRGVGADRRQPPLLEVGRPHGVRRRRPGLDGLYRRGRGRPGQLQAGARGPLGLDPGPGRHGVARR